MDGTRPSHLNNGQPDQWCLRHWRQAVRKANEYHDALRICGMMLQAFVNREEIMREAGWDPDKGTQARVECLNDIMAQHSPICCYLGDRTMTKIITEARAKRGNDDNKQ